MVCRRREPRRERAEKRPVRQTGLERQTPRYVKSNPGGTKLEMPAPPVAATSKPSPREARIAAKKGAPKQQGKYSTQVGGVYESKAPLNAWTKLAHALFQSKEAMFYN